MRDKRKTLAMGVYPEVSLAAARKRRDKARELLAQGIDPSTAKREDKQAKTAEAHNTFEAVALAWLKVTAAQRSEATTTRARAWLQGDVLPAIGAMPMASIGPRDVLAVLRKIEARGAIDTARRVGQTVGQIFRFAVAAGLAERDVTADLRGALTVPKKSTTPPSPSRWRWVPCGAPCTTTTAALAPWWPSSCRRCARPMSENTVNAALRGMGYTKEVQTAYGFRATARTIMDEVLEGRVDLIEHQLAHTVKDANGRAYNRTAHLPARHQMMQRWADYLDRLRVGAEVIPLAVKMA